MTPTELNKRIRDGEFFRVETGKNSSNGLPSELQALKARTITEKVMEEATIPDTREGAVLGDKVTIQVSRPGERHVQIHTAQGWIYATRVRPASGEWICIFGEGRMDRALN